MSQPYNVSMINCIYLLTPFVDIKITYTYIIYHINHLTQIISHSLSTVLRYTCVYTIHMMYPSSRDISVVILL